MHNRHKERSFRLHAGYGIHCPCKQIKTKKAQMVIYYTLKILFILYDNCHDKYSFYLFLYPYVCCKQDSVKLKMKSQMILYFDYSNPALGLFHLNYAWGQTVSLSMTLLNLEGYYFSRKLHTSKEGGHYFRVGPCFRGGRYFRVLIAR